MDAITRRQFQAMWQLKLRLLLRFWYQRDSLYRWSMLFSVFFSAVVACGLGVGIGFLVQLPLNPIAKNALWPELIQYLWTGVFLSISLFWILSPLMFVLKNESLSLDISRLTRYPIAYRTLHTFHTLLALIEPWSLFFYPMALGVVVGTLWYGGSVTLGPVLVLVLLWMLVNTVWSRLVQDFVTVLFTSRYLREFLSLSLILMLIALAFVPALISENTALEQLQGLRAPSIEMLLYQWPFWQWLQPILSGLLYATPAGWFAHALTGIQTADWRSWAEGCLSLFLWMSLANFFGVKLLRRLFLEPPVLPTLLNGRERNASEAGFLASQIPYLLHTLILKELRTYFRSILGKLSFFLTPLLVVVLRLVGLGASGNYPPASLLLGMTVYIFMTSLFLYINFFGPDQEGFKLYLLAGVPERLLILGKNAALALFAGAEFAVVLVLYVLLYRHLDLQTLWFGVCSFLSLLLGVLSMGNILSLRFPGAMDLNQTQYRQSNGTPILLALQIVTLLAFVTSLPLWLAYLRQEPLWLLSMALTLLMALTWWLLLPFCEELLRHKRWQVLEAVTQRE